MNLTTFSLYNLSHKENVFNLSCVVVVLALVENTVTMGGWVRIVESRSSVPVIATIRSHIAVEVGKRGRYGRKFTDDRTT